MPVSAPPGPYVGVGGGEGSWAYICRNLVPAPCGLGRSVDILGPCVLTTKIPGPFGPLWQAATFLGRFLPWWCPALAQTLGVASGLQLDC